MRHTYATGFVVSTIGNDPNATFAQFLIAYGGHDIVTPDGKLHADDPQVQEAVIKALEKLPACTRTATSRRARSTGTTPTTTTRSTRSCA